MVSSQIASSSISTGGVAGAVDAALSLTNPVGAILTGVNQVAALFGLNSSDPGRDQQRINRINVAFDLAMRGNDTPQTTGSPDSNLEGMTGAQYLEYIATNDHGRGNPPVYGSQIAYRYAQGKYAEYKTRVTAGTVGVGLIGVSDIPAKISQVVTSSVGVVVIAVVVVIGIVILTRKGRG
jgi:hypothetical protein